MGAACGSTARAKPAASDRTSFAGFGNRYAGPTASSASACTVYCAAIQPPSDSPISVKSPVTPAVAQELAEEVDPGLDVVGDDRLVRRAEAEQVEGEHAMRAAQGPHDLAPVAAGAAAEPVHQDHRGPATELEVADLLAEEDRGLLRRQARRRRLARQRKTEDRGRAGGDEGSPPPPRDRRRHSQLTRNCTPTTRGSLMKPSRLLKSIAPFTRIWFVQLRQKAAAS